MDLQLGKDKKSLLKKYEEAGKLTREYEKNEDGSQGDFLGLRFKNPQDAEEFRNEIQSGAKVVNDASEGDMNRGEERKRENFKGIDLIRPVGGVEVDEAARRRVAPGAA